MKNRAYATLEIKAAEEVGGKRTFRGIASTISTDRMDDVVEPGGAEYELPIPFLWQHSSSEPIGWITKVTVTGKKIEVEGEVHNETQPGKLKDRLDEAWQTLKAKLVRGLSIGFNPLESARIEGTYGYRYIRWAWLELSAVTIAANADCSITAIKSVDNALRAASGQHQRDGGGNLPGASGASKAAHGGTSSTTRSPKGNTMKTIAELRAAREEKMARMKELTEQKATSETKRFDADQAKEFDDLNEEVDSIDDQIRELNFHAKNSAGAREVRGQSGEDGSRSRGPTIIVKTKDADDAFPGQSFVRQVIAKAAADLLHISSLDIAQTRWGKSNPGLVKLMQVKAGVPGGGTGSGEWGAELALADTRYNGDFIEYLYSKTVYDKLGLRVVPARVHIKGQDGQGTGYWVGESKPIPSTTLDFSDVELSPLKAAALAVISNELLLDSDPSAERLVRDALVEASSQRVDITFLSDAAASNGVSPAGIINGVTGIDTAGADAAGLRSDIKALYRPFITAKNASGLVLVMNPATAKALSLLVNALGQTEFPGLNADGGTLLGDRVVTGDNVDPSNIYLIKPSDIYRIGDTGVDVAMSKDAMIEQDTAPTGATDTPVAASATMVSMFQENSTAIRVIRRISFAKRRTSAVSWIRNADYDGVVS